MYVKKCHKSLFIFLGLSDFEIIYFSSKGRKVIDKNNEYKYHKIVRRCLFSIFLNVIVFYSDIDSDEVFKSIKMC